MRDRKPTGRAAAAQSTLKAMRAMDAKDDKKRAAKRNEERIARQARRQKLLADLDAYNTSAKGDLVKAVVAHIDNEDGLEALLHLCRSVHTDGYQEGERDEERRVSELE